MAYVRAKEIKGGVHHLADFPESFVFSLLKAKAFS